MAAAARSRGRLTIFRGGGGLLRAAYNRLEEGLLAFILATMTPLTFLQAVLRYVFNTGLLWVLDIYHLPVRVAGSHRHLLLCCSIARISASMRWCALCPPQRRRYVGLLVLALTLLYTGLMLYGEIVLIDKMHTIGV